MKFYCDIIKAIKEQKKRERVRRIQYRILKMQRQQIEDSAHKRRLTAYPAIRPAEAYT